ncbi:MAG: hypothetical protein ACP5KE_05100 [Candidatus Methanodesulfokora sp.]
MAVRVKLRISLGDKIVSASALVNSGYEADTPQLMIPIALAKHLGLWPPENAEEDLFDTAGGPLSVWICRNAADVAVISEAGESKEVRADIVISALADEVVISDILAGELEIAIEDPASGLWRFRWEPKDSLRRTERPQRWR